MTLGSRFCDFPSEQSARLCPPLESNNPAHSFGGMPNGTVEALLVRSTQQDRPNAAGLYPISPLKNLPRKRLVPNAGYIGASLDSPDVHLSRPHRTFRTGQPRHGVCATVQSASRAPLLGAEPACLKAVRSSGEQHTPDLLEDIELRPSNTDHSTGAILRKDKLVKR